MKILRYYKPFIIFSIYINNIFTYNKLCNYVIYFKYNLGGKHMNRCLSCMNTYEENTNICPFCAYDQTTAPREAYHLKPGIVLHGRYIVGKVLGYGGFGVTYIGFDAKLERKVAIKEFLPTTFATRLPGDTHLTVYNNGNVPQQFGTGLQRFVEEAQTLAQFNGVPGIVDIYDTYLGNNTAYIVMQFLKGSDVKGIITNQGVMEYEMARDIILKVCDTLTAVHAKNIIHRDLSPDNIYVTDEGDVKLLDFGAARYESAVNSKSLSVILKSGYAPEEQYRSKGEQGAWTDVYALAATFYKMITGQTPPDSMERAINDEIQEPSKLGAKIPPSVENALLNALHVRKSDRTQTVAQFKEQLLADGVQRIKVKPKKESTKASLAAKITIGICAVFLVGFGIFAASGGFSGEDVDPIVIGGTQLEDNFGTAEKEGFAAVPNITGMTYDDALLAVEEYGFTIKAQEIETSMYNNTSRQNLQVTEQHLNPGYQLEEGGEIPVTVFISEIQDAVDKGIIEDVTQMASKDAINYVNKITNAYIIHYAYSDTIAAGEPIGFVKEYDREYNSETEEYEQGEHRNTVFTLSAGPVPSTESGTQIAHGFMYGNSYSEPDLYYCVTNGNEDFYDEYLRVMQVSKDGGATWQPIGFEENGSSLGTLEPGEHALNLSYFFNLSDKNFADVELMFKLELRQAPQGEEYSYGDASTLSISEAASGTLIDSFTFANTVTYTLEEIEGVRVDSVEKLSLKQMNDEIEQFDISGEDEIREQIVNYNEWSSDEFFKITGEFPVDDSYSHEYYYRPKPLMDYSMLQKGDARQLYLLNDTSLREGDTIIFKTAYIVTSTYGSYEDGLVGFAIDRESEIDVTTDENGNFHITKKELEITYVQDVEFSPEGAPVSGNISNAPFEFANTVYKLMMSGGYSMIDYYNEMATPIEVSYQDNILNVIFEEDGGAIVEITFDYMEYDDENDDEATNFAQEIIAAGMENPEDIMMLFDLGVPLTVNNINIYGNGDFLFTLQEMFYAEDPILIELLYMVAAKIMPIEEAAAAFEVDLSDYIIEQDDGLRILTSEYDIYVDLQGGGDYIYNMSISNYA